MTYQHNKYWWQAEEDKPEIKELCGIPVITTDLGTDDRCTIISRNPDGSILDKVTIECDVTVIKKGTSP